jgi:hypothetical protein
MPAVQIRQGLWNDLVLAAEEKRQKPEALANQVVRDFLQRLADDDLLTRGARSARRSPLRTGDTEEAIRRYRRGK